MSPLEGLSGGGGGGMCERKEERTGCCTVITVYTQCSPASTVSVSGKVTAYHGVSTVQ